MSYSHKVENLIRGEGAEVALVRVRVFENLLKKKKNKRGMLVRDPRVLRHSNSWRSGRKGNTEKLVKEE